MSKSYFIDEELKKLPEKSEPVAEPFYSAPEKGLNLASKTLVRCFLVFFLSFTCEKMKTQSGIRLFRKRWDVEISMNELRADYFHIAEKMASSPTPPHPRHRNTVSSQFRAKCHKHDDDVCLQDALAELRYLSFSHRLINYPMCLCLLYAFFWLCFGARRASETTYGCVPRTPN